MLSRLGAQLLVDNRPPVPVTVPALSCLNVPVVDDGAERREIADKFAEFRIVAKGRDAWEAVARAERETFDHWKAVAAALIVGRNHSLRAAGTSTPNGAHYTAALSGWLTQNFGNRPMPKATRYWCCRLHENLPDIERWRATLPESWRAKLINPLSVCRAWLRATQPKSRCTDNPVKAAEAALARFVAHVEALRPEQALPLWRAVQAQATAHL
jgi:hypothetical protein